MKMDMGNYVFFSLGLSALIFGGLHKLHISKFPFLCLRRKNVVVGNVGQPHLEKNGSYLILFSLSEVPRSSCKHVAGCWEVLGDKQLASHLCIDQDKSHHFHHWIRFNAGTKSPSERYWQIIALNRFRFLHISSQNVKLCLQGHSLHFTNRRCHSWLLCSRTSI